MTAQRALTRLVDVHSHVSPAYLPATPDDAAGQRWPCMCHDPARGSRMMFGDVVFRVLDGRSWDVARRLDDMDRHHIAVQVLSPMPELLAYWLAADATEVIADACNHQIAEMIARAPRRFRGLGTVPLQDPRRAAAAVVRLRRDFGLSGMEIGSNVDGVMLGDRRLDPFWEAAEAEGMAVFVHALHPVAAKPIVASPLFTAAALFPIDVGMAAASIITSGVCDRYPRLKIGFSHGGGTIGSMLGRLDLVWARSDGFQGQTEIAPRHTARGLFYDSNVYDPAYLSHLISAVAPGQVFVGTDYPYDIMQDDPPGFLGRAQLDDEMLESLAIDAASTFLSEDLRALMPGVESIATAVAS